MKMSLLSYQERMREYADGVMLNIVYEFIDYHVLIGSREHNVFIFKNI